MSNLAGRMRNLEKLLAKPLPTDCPPPDRPKLDLSKLSLVTRWRILLAMQQLKPANHPVGQPFTFDLQSLSMETRLKMLEELRAPPRPEPTIEERLADVKAFDELLNQHFDHSRETQ